MTDDFYRALQHCIVLVRQGVPLEECLTQYPEYAKELMPLLQAATIPSREDADSSNSRLPSAVQTRLCQWVLGHWDCTHALKQQYPQVVPAFSLPWAAVMVLAVLASIALVGGVSTAMAAEDSVPGTSLYPVKELREETRLWLTHSPEEKVAVYTGFVEERTQEIIRLARVEERGPAAVAVARLEQHISAVDQLIEENAPRHGSSEASASEAIITALENALAEQASVNTVIQETLGQAPEEAYPCVQHTLQVIQRARSQVRSALEAVGQDFPQAPAESGEGSLTLCPH
jgi:hypothetical protein